PPARNAAPARGRPRTTTCDRLSAPGFNKIGFMSTVGSTPAASAWAAWARPISPPSIVTDEFNAMFCDLNGATRYPARAKRRQKAVARTDLPTAELMPWIIRHGASPFMAFPPRSVDRPRRGLVRWRRPHG